MSSSEEWVFKAQLLRAAKNPSLEDLVSIVPAGRMNVTELAAVLGLSYPTALKIIRDPHLKVNAYRTSPSGAWQIPVEDVHRLMTLRWK